MDKKRMAEFIGVMLGDGHIGVYDFVSCGRNKKLHQLKVTLDSRNEDYVYYVRDLMKEILGIEPKVFFKKNENAVDVRIYNKEKVLFALNEIGLVVSPKWGKMRIPDGFAFGELGLFVLRGLFDTDGSVTIFNNNGIVYPRIEIRICPSPAQEQVFKILDENGFNYKIQKFERGDVKIRISGKKELVRWFEIAGCSNLSHKNRAEKFLKKDL